MHLELTDEAAIGTAAKFRHRPVGIQPVPLKDALLLGGSWLHDQQSRQEEQQREESTH